MSEVVSVVEQEQQQQQQQQQQQLQQQPQQQLQQPQQQQQQQQQQQPPAQQQYVGGSSNTEPYCEECNVPFNSDKSLQVHLHYHKQNLINRWANPGQQESNNNNSKAGNHNKHVNVKQESVTVPTDSRESSSSQDPSQQQQQPQPQQPPIQAYNNYLAPISFPGVTHLLQNMSHVQNISMGTCQPFSPPQEDVQNNGGGNGGGGNVGGGGYARYHPYSQHFAAEHANTNSTSPHSPPFHCENCGAVYEDANQLGEHMKTHHSDSPTGYAPAPQYQQLGGSPPQPDQQQQQQQQQQQVQQQAQQQLHPSPTHSSQQQQQQPGYDYNGGQPVKLEMKQEPEEQTEILDLDSHKVQQTHRYQEELMRFQQQHRQHQEIQLHMHHQQQVMQQHPQRLGHSLIGWPPVAQTHDYHSGLPPMGPMDSMPPIADQNQFMRGQHIPVVEAPVHQAPSIITNAQPIAGHQMSSGLPLQQPLKPPSNQTWKSNEPRRPKTYNCTACNKWFTSSGHLKRHYNTTLHKNAVKQSNQPDPAGLPISAHHHPARENNGAHPTGGRGSGGGGGNVGGGAPERSPDFTSSGSPPNVMAGPSGEATGGLHHTPIPHYNSSSSSNSNSNDSLAAAAALAQQQGPPSAVHLGSGMVPHSSPQQSSMAGHHQQPMGSPSHQMGLQQQQQPLHHLPMTSPGQHQVHHSMTSPISPMHPPPASHMSSPSPMDSSTHPHHMNSSSTITPGTVHPAMVSPTAMGGTSMPHQPYPNALPPHVTNTTSIPGLLESTIRTSIGNDQNQNDQHQQREQHQQQQHQQAQENMLPGFGTLNQHQTLRSFTQLLPGYGDQNQPQAVNVGGLSSEEATQEKSYSSSIPSYDMFTESSSSYTMMQVDVGVGSIHVATDDVIMSQYDAASQQSFSSNSKQMQHGYHETNNNVLPHMMQIKQEPMVIQPPAVRRGRKPKSTVLKEQQVTSQTIKTIMDETDTRTVQCDECTKKFNKVCYLTQHKKSFHMGEKPFKCTQCGKRFFSQEEHLIHLQKHEGDKPHKCDSCPKQFNHKTDLRRHRCLHTGDKPHSCDNCGKKFIRKDHMVKHVATHMKKFNNNRKPNTEHKKENVRKRVSQCQ